MEITYHCPSADRTVVTVGINNALSIVGNTNICATLIKIQGQSC